MRTVRVRLSVILHVSKEMPIKSDKRYVCVITPLLDAVILDGLLIEGKQKYCKHCYKSIRPNNKTIPFMHLCTVNCQI